MNDCQHEEKIDEYLKGELSPDNTARFEEHYFNCPSCFYKTREKSELLGLIKQAKEEIFSPAERDVRRRGAGLKRITGDLTPRRWMAVAATAALALAAVLLIAPKLKRASPGLVFDGDMAVRGESLSVIAPRGEGKAAPVSFEWRPLASAAEYQVTLSGAKMEWTTTTKETKVALPPDIKAALKAGIYAWQVKAYSGQGTLLASSPKVEFKITD